MGKNIDKFVGNSKESSNSTVDNTKSEDNLTEEQLTILLCKELEKGSQEYDVNESIRALANLKEQRIIYSVISDEMYSMSNKDDQSAEIGNFISNIEKLKNAVSEDSRYQDLRPYAIRLYDHAHLALNQINVFKLSKEDFESIISSSETINTKMESLSSQVLSLVALFTAMAFLVFGGLSSFESIFSNINNTSTLKLIILSTIWGLGILNTIAVFMFFTSRIIGKSFRQDNRDNATLFQKYPYLILGNYILILIFTVCCSLFFITKNFDLSQNVFSADFWNIKKVLILAVSIISCTYVVFPLREKLFNSKQSLNAENSQNSTPSK